MGRKKKTDKEIEIHQSDPSTHYVDNAAFYEEMKAFRSDPENIRRVAAGQRPIIPNSIGKKIMDICNRLASKFNFSRYSFKEIMIDDALNNCIRYIWNFDPEKSTKPFSYFSMITEQAFIRRIQREKKRIKDHQNYVDNIIFENHQDNEGPSEEEQSISKELNETLFGPSASEKTKNDYSFEMGMDFEYEE